MNFAKTKCFSAESKGFENGITNICVIDDERLLLYINFLYRTHTHTYSIRFGSVADSGHIYNGICAKQRIAQESMRTTKYSAEIVCVGVKAVGDSGEKSIMESMRDEQAVN